MAKKSSGSKASKSNPKVIKNISVSGWHKWLALVFAVQGVAILLFSAVRTYPVTLNYLGLDTLQTNAQGKTVLATGSQSIFDVNLAIVVAVFLFVAAIFHGLLASRWQEKYERDIKNRVNVVRWVEYAISASVMLVTVALVAGVQDLAVLLVVFGTTALFSVLALLAERYSSRAGKANWALFWLSCSAAVLAWIVIKLYILGGAIYGSVPGYVYWVDVVAFLLFALVPVNLYLQLRKVGNWQNYPYVERMYVLASLAAKTVVAWLIFAAILHP